VFIGLFAAVTNGLLAAAGTFAELGDGTYSYIRESATTFARDIDKLAAEANEDVAKFCATKGKQPKVISITAHKPWMTLGIPKVTVLFKALDAGDPALLGNTAVPIVRAGKKSKTVEAVAPPVPANDLYSELLKLDDLRKKGILTEDEFKAEKTKVLNRSK
jgi:hypothetical protein